MRIWVYTVCYNEEKLIPYFLQHYDFAEKIIVYDNYSSDNGPNLLKDNKKIELRFYDTGGQLDCAEGRRLKNNIWKEAYGKCDYVIVIDMDEFLYIKGGIIPFLRKYRPTIVKSTAYDMILLNNNSINDKPLTDQIKNGVRSHYYDKTVLFSPNNIREMNYNLGCHKCVPKGIINYSPSPVILLHYKYAFGLDYIIKRHKMYASRMNESIRNQNSASEYWKLTEDDIRKDFNIYQKTSNKVI